MIFTPEHTIIKEGQCFFGTQVTAKGHDCLNKDVLKQLWHGSTYRVSQLKGLIKGYITLLDQIKAIDLEEGQTILAVDCCEIKDSPQIANQMAHFCIFPDTELWELHKFLRLCGMLTLSRFQGGAAAKSFRPLGFVHGSHSHSQWLLLQWQSCGSKLCKKDKD